MLLNVLIVGVTLHENWLFYLIVSPISFLELWYDAFDKKFANLRYLDVDDREKRGVDRGELRGSELGLHDRSAEQTFSTNDIFFKKLENNMLQVACVNLKKESNIHTYIVLSFF